MSATISASVKFCPEMRTVPLSDDPAEPESDVVLLLLLLLPQAVSSAAALAATTPARRRRDCIGSHLLCPAPWCDARVRCPRFQGMSAHHAPTPEVMREREAVSLVAVPLRFGSTAR